MNLLRRGPHQDEPPRASAPPVHVWTRRAHKDGHELVRMHCFSSASEFLVLCDVFPPSGGGSRRVQAGPYVFHSRHEADEFAEEAGLVLGHLGCTTA